MCGISFKITRAKFRYILDCNYLAPHTTIRDQNNLQVSAFAATRSASCHIRWGNNRNLTDIIDKLE